LTPTHIILALIPESFLITDTILHYNQSTEQKGVEMSTELETTEQKERKVDVKVQGGGSETVYGLGLIGAWVYYIGRATTFQEGVKGFLKGIVWPAILVYKLIEFFEKE
jgi:hypothetical protein